MRLSCNGCRVLRKGCGDDCTIRPCLSWIKNPESQAHATLFLAKFYGRAGLLNLINAGPHHLRPAIFRSLLYEACGRIVNPIFGSVGLLWSGKWQLCQAAVESVLKGVPLTPIPSDTLALNSTPPLKASGDVRHVTKGCGSKLHNVLKSNRRQFKSAGKDKKFTIDYGKVDRSVLETKETASQRSQAKASSMVELEDDDEEEEDQAALQLKLGLESVNPDVQKITRDSNMHGIDLNL